MGRRKSFEDLSDQPIVTRVPDSSRSRLKELAKDPSRRSLNALMTEIMTFFLLEKPYEKGLKFRIPRFTIRFEKGTPVRTGWMQFNVYLTVDLKDRMMVEIERLRRGKASSHSCELHLLRDLLVACHRRTGRGREPRLLRVPEKDAWRVEEGGEVNGCTDSLEKCIGSSIQRVFLFCSRSGRDIKSTGTIIRIWNR